MPSTAPRSPAPTVATTNSPDRRLTPAASSWASSFSPNPCAVAKRSPKEDTLSGIQPEPALAAAAPPSACGTGRPIAAIRAAMSRSAFTRAAVPNRSHPSANAASATSATTTASIASLEKKVSAASIAYRPFSSSAKISGSIITPRSWSFSMNLGRRPVDLRRPRKRPSSSSPAE